LEKTAQSFEKTVQKLGVSMNRFQKFVHTVDRDEITDFFCSGQFFDPSYLKKGPKSDRSKKSC
jgi:hypothetical protein